MQKTLTVNGKIFTAKDITLLQKDITVGGDYMTKINNELYFWNYRQIQDAFFAPVCSPDNANAIALMPNNGSYIYSVWMSL